MPDNSYQQLAELIIRVPGLLGPGGLFGGLNEEHGLAQDFVHFARGLKREDNISSETITIANFLQYLEEKGRETEKIASTLYDMKQKGGIVENPGKSSENTLFLLAEILIASGIGENFRNTAADYEIFLSRILQQGSEGEMTGGDRSAAARPAAGRPTTGAMPKLAGGGTGQPQKSASGNEAEVGETGDISEQQTASVSATETKKDAGAEEIPGAKLEEKDQTETQAKPKAEAALKKAAGRKPDTGEASPDSLQAKRVNTEVQPEKSVPGSETGTKTGITSGRGKTDRAGAAAALLGAARAAQNTGNEPVTGGIPGPKTPMRIPVKTAGMEKPLKGTKALPTDPKRHVAQVPGGRMKKSGAPAKKEKAGPSPQAQAELSRQAQPLRTPEQDFGNYQAAQPKPKRKIGKRVAKAAAGTGALVLIKGMYGGAAAKSATINLIPVILELLK